MFAGMYDIIDYLDDVRFVLDSAVQSENFSDLAAAIHDKITRHLTNQCAYMRLYQDEIDPDIRMYYRLIADVNKQHASTLEFFAMEAQRDMSDNDFDVLFNMGYMRFPFKLERAKKLVSDKYMYRIN